MHCSWIFTGGSFLSCMMYLESMYNLSTMVYNIKRFRKYLVPVFSGKCFDLCYPSPTSLDY